MLGPTCLCISYLNIFNKENQSGNPSNESYSNNELNQSNVSHVRHYGSNLLQYFTQFLLQTKQIHVQS